MSIDNSLDGYILVKVLHVEAEIDQMLNNIYSWRYLIVEKRFENALQDNDTFGNGDMYKTSEIEYDQNIVKAFYEIYGMQYGGNICNSIDFGFEFDVDYDIKYLQKKSRLKNMLCTNILTNKSLFIDEDIIKDSDGFVNLTLDSRGNDLLYCINKYHMLLELLDDISDTVDSMN